ncbi:putative odorant-binding protein A5 [Bemisia tabaci]|uniref:putative odorant-binding protein A5 n=1 Tax=Bemisia tabaci TaxID=7038 RepID=UPI003B27D748
MPIRVLRQFILTSHFTIFITCTNTRTPPTLTSTSKHKQKQLRGIQENSTKAPQNSTLMDLPVFTHDEIDPEIKPYIDKVYNDSDFDKIVYADGDKVTILYDRDKESEDDDPEIQRLLRKMKEESNDEYRRTKMNYFNHTVGHFLNKTEEELKFLQERNQIYDDLIEKPAPNIIQVAYGKVVVALGNEIHAKHTTRMPSYVTWPAEDNSQYCLIMTDPDTSYHSRPGKPREYQHWVVVNIPGNNLSGGEFITEYVRPHPEFDGVGFHRFIFFVFKQEKKDKIYDEIKLSHIPVKSLRKGFSTKLFAKKNNLKGPVAINFFIARWDKSIDEEEEIFGPLVHGQNI